MTCRNGLLVLTLLFGAARMVCAEYTFTGERLFHDVSERSALEAGIKSEPVPVAVTALTPDRTTDIVVQVPVQHAVSFDGIVIRHNMTGSSSVITWVNGKPAAPLIWQTQSLSSYEHRVYRFGRSLSLKLGQTRIVSQETPVESK